MKYDIVYCNADGSTPFGQCKHVTIDKRDRHTAREEFFESFPGKQIVSMGSTDEIAKTLAQFDVIVDGYLSP